jgi:hypothetical protein
MRRINVLMNSMHRRIRAVTDARGGHTRYWRVNQFHFNILGGTVKLASILKTCWLNLCFYPYKLYINIEKNIRINNIKSPKMLTLRFFSLQCI